VIGTGRPILSYGNTALKLGFITQDNMNGGTRVDFELKVCL
jgi:hypothetical protein